MSADSLPAVDAWRMVSAGRVLDGELPLASLSRLRDLLVDAEGVVRWRVEFGRDSLQVPFAKVWIEAGLPLVCQRSLQPFVLPVVVEQALGLIREESEEAALPPGYEPLLVPADGRIVPVELIEDELIMAVPVVAYSPDAPVVDRDWPVQEEEAAAANPFSALSALRSGKDN